VSRRHRRRDDRPQRGPSTALAPAGGPQDRQASRVLAHALPPHVRPVRPRRSAVAAGAGPHLRRGRLPPGITAVAVNARARERHTGRGASQTCRRGGGHAAVAGRHPRGLAGVPGPPARLIRALAREPAGRHEAGGGLRRAAPGDAVARWRDPSQAMAHHGVARCPDGEVAPCRVVVGRLVHDIAQAQVVQPAGDEAEVIDGLTAVGWCQQFSAQAEIRPMPRMTPMPSRVCEMSVLSLR
jgi:hypothetical protein